MNKGPVPECVLGAAVSPPNLPPSAYTAYGLYDSRTVPGFGARSNSDQMFATMHMADNSGGCSEPGCWSEIGWQASGGVGACGPTLQVFAFNPRNQQQWWCGAPNGFTLAPGAQIWVAVLSAGAPFNTWYDYLWGGTWGNSAWYIVDSTTLSSSYATGEFSPDMDIEIFTFATSIDQFPTLSPAYSLSAQIETCVNGCWVNWDTSVPGSYLAWDDYPYAVGVPSAWQDWYGCGPVGVAC